MDFVSVQRKDAGPAGNRTGVCSFFYANLMNSGVGSPDLRLAIFLARRMISSSLWPPAVT
jgi:hypothetical protein